MSRITEDFSSNLVRLRKKKNLTQEQLAELSGLSWGAIRTAESGASFLRPHNIEAIAKVLEVDPIKLFMDESDLPPKEWTDAELLEALVERFGFEPPGLKKADPTKKKKKA